MPAAFLVLPAPAKINLLLRIIGQRADGYHNLQTVFQFLDYGDDLTFECLAAPDIHCTGDLSELPMAQNLIYKAAQLLQQTYIVNQGVKIHLTKRLPLGGGVGGGSSDAATTLMALNHLWSLQLSTEQLMSLALQLGADVPIFIYGHAAWAEGIGEQLSPLVLPELWYLVITPGCQVSTREIFMAKNLTRNSNPITMHDFILGVRDNTCLPVVCERYPAVKEALTWLQCFANAFMSGTGASVFAAFPDKCQAEVVLHQMPIGWRGFVAQGVNQSPLLKCLDFAKDML